MTTRRQHVEVIKRAFTHEDGRMRSAEASLQRLIRRRGVTNVLTDEAIHQLALDIIYETRLHNRFAAESRKRYAERTRA